MPSSTSGMSKSPVIPGKRVGTKRRDMRWQAPDGTVWASRFEYGVFLAHASAGIPVRKCDESDCVRYTRPVRNAACGECGSARVATTHTYTPDLSVDPEEHRKRKALDDDGPYVIECKGYLRADRRSLLRALCKERPDLPLRFIVERDYKVSRSLSITGWIRKFLKKPAVVWDGNPPDWSRLT